MIARLLGLGTACPTTALSQEEALDAILRLVPGLEARRSGLAALFRRTGIDRRHSAILGVEANRPPFGLQHGERGPSTALRMAAFEQEARPLVRDASLRALADAGVAPGAITHLVSVTCTGFAAPGFDLALIADLDLARTVERTQVGFMGCHGALNGLRVAKALAEADPRNRVLLAAVEVCSAHVACRVDDGASVSNSLFADGAAAAVIGIAEGSDALRLLGNGGYVFPDTEDLMSWRIGDHGFEMTLSPRVPQVIGEGLADFVANWLRRGGHDPARIASFAVHPGGTRILAAVEQALCLGDGGLVTSRAIYREFGNMSSPTVMFILERLLREEAPRPIVALGFGPGLAVEAALLG